MKYQIYWATGATRTRQMDAGREGCIAYVEHHFNALEKDNPDTQADNPALALVGSNASIRSFTWAHTYTKLISAEFGIRNAGVIRGPKRGNWNVYYTKCPAILVEPLFCSDPEQAKLIKSDGGQARLAYCLARSIRETFPEGGKVAFSVGHKYRPPPRGRDLGAPVFGGGWEADYAEKVLQLAAKDLESGET